MIRALNSWWPLSLLALLAGPAYPQALRENAPPEAVEAPAHPRFQRIYAPADRLRDWPFDNQRYVPVDPQEFEKLAEFAQDAVSENTPAGPARIVSAVYDVRLQAEGTLAGTALLAIEAPIDAASLLVLEPFAPAIGDAQWQTPVPRPATLGADERGRLVVLAGGPGELRVQWTLRGSVAVDGSTEYEVELPRCSQSRMTLRLPPEMSVAVDRGVVVPPVDSSGEERKWRVELAGGGRFRLHLSDQSAPSAPQASALLRESLTYQIWPHGVDVSVGWRIDVRREPIRRLQFSLDENCRVVAAQMGTAALPWTVGTDESTGESRLTILFPEGVQGAGQSLQLAMICPLRLERRWRLPTIRPLDAIWEEGELTLLVPESLSLSAMFAVDCRQIKVGRLGSPIRGESHVFQCFSPAAELDVVITTRQPRLHVTTGTTVELSETPAARVLADVTATEGEVYSLSARAAPGWIIDSVESIPADWLNDWTSEVDETGGVRIALRLSRPVKQGQPLRLVVTGRRPGLATSGDVSVAHLAPLEFDDVSISRDFLALRAGAGNAIATDSLAAAKLMRDELTQAQQGLFEAPWDETVLDLNLTTPEDEIAVVRQQPLFHGAIEVDVELTRRGIAESYAIRCVPESGPINRVVVAFSHRREEPLVWTSLTDGGAPLVARKWSANELASSGFPPSGETWEVSLGRTRGAPIEISASRTTSLSQRQAISLATLPRAGRQLGAVKVRSSADLSVEIARHGPTPMPPDGGRADEYGSAIAAFRYQPAHAVGDGKRPALLLSVSPGYPQLPQAFVWDARLTSQFGADRSAHHTAEFRLENCGRSGVTVTVPVACSAMWISLDGQTVKGQTNSDGVFVPLPSGRRHATLQVAFLTEGDAWGLWQRLQAPFPRIDLPVIRAQWQVQLPPGFEMLNATGDWSSEGGRTWSLSERLFGPLGRPLGIKPFDPTSSADWKNAALTWRQNQATSRANRLFELLGDQVMANTPGEPPAPDWGAAIGALSNQLGGSADRLLIDSGALADLGLTRKTRISTREPADRARTGASLLEEMGLVLLVNADTDVITSSQAAATVGARISWLPGIPAAQLAPGPDTGGPDLVNSAGMPLISARRWTSADEASWGAERLPWSSLESPNRAANHRGGWSSYRLAGTLDAAPVITVVDRDLWRISGSLTFFCALALGWWLSARNRRVLIPLMAALGSIALLAPDPFVPAASSAVLAILACWVLRCLATVRRPHAAPVYVAADGGSAVKLQLATVRGWSVSVLPLAICIAATTTVAQDDNLTNATDTAPLYRVFIPVDEARNPNGDAYQVPEPLLKSLRTLAASARQSVQGWIARSAVYRARLDNLPSPGDDGQILINVSVDLSVLEEGLRVRIPVAREYLAAEVGAVSLDGDSLDVEWSADNQSFSFATAEMGDYRLQLLLRGVVSASDGAYRLETAAVPAALARLVLDLPPTPIEIEVPSARGIVRREQQRRRVTADLGRGGRIRLEWPTQAAAESVQPPLEVDELLWLRIQPGSVHLDARFTFSTEGRTVDTIRIATEPRLRPRSLPAANARIASAEWISTDDFTGLQYQLKPYSGDEPLVIEAQLRLTEATGVGRQRLPYIEPLKTVSSRRLLAVSVDPSLEYSDAAEIPPNAIDVENFLTTWGEAEKQPFAAFQIGREDIAWSLFTKPGRQRTSCRQHLALSAGERRHDVRLRATVATQGGASFVHRVAVPPELRIRRVAVLEDGVIKTSRWARHETAGLTIFLGAPATGPQDVEVDGWLPAVSGESVQLPDIRVEADLVESREVEVYRRPHVTVRVENPVAPIENSSTDDQNDGLGQRVAVFDMTGRTETLKILVRPNRPQLRAVETVVVRRQQSVWSAQFVYQISVTDGVVDNLWLTMPSEVAGTLEIDPPLPYTLEPSDEHGRRRLVIRPDSPLEGQFKLSIRAPLVLAAGEDLHVPQVPSTGFDRTQRYLILPVQFDQSFALWETTGLTPVETPTDILHARISDDTLQAFRVIQPRFGAQLRSVERPAGVPRVQLADYHIVWTDSGGYRGLAVFDVEPFGTDHGVLRMPGNCRPLHVAVERNSALATRRDDETLHLRFTSEQLSQRIEILFQGDWRGANDGRSSPSFPVPTLDEMPVRRSLWTVRGPSRHGATAKKSDGGPSAVQQQMRRLESIDAMIHGAARTAATTSGGTRNAPTEEIARWFPPWARRARSAYRALSGAISHDGSAEQGAAALSKANELQEEQAALARDVLNSGDIWAQTDQEASTASEPTDIWSHVHSRYGNLSLGSVEGRVEQIAVEHPTTLPAWFDRCLLALGLLLTSIVAAAPVGKRLVQSIRRWPEAVGVAVGVGWWLWLSPSALGWLIVAASLMLSLRPSGGRRQTPDPGSSVIPIRVSGA